MTGTSAFVDTNTFVYAVDESPSERRKHDLAAHLLAEDTSARAISRQVLQEFYVTVTRTLNTLMSPERAGHPADVHPGRRPPG
jgi:predicted nucleic acid-binding protein